MDEKLTKSIQNWLDTASEQQDIAQGATLLLKLNKNRILFQNAVRRPDKYAEKVRYELKKFLAMRLDQKTTEDVVLMQSTLVPGVKDLLDLGEPEGDLITPIPGEAAVEEAEKKVIGNTATLGRRSDHDSLPTEIKALWEHNIAIYKSIKQIFETLKGMEQALPCDRYEYLKQLEELDSKYRSNFEKYDTYKEEKNGGEDGGSLSSADIAKAVSAARKYISDNKSKLAELKESDAEKYAELLAKVQERYNFLVSNNNGISDDQKAEIAALGVIIE